MVPLRAPLAGECRNYTILENTTSVAGVEIRGPSWTSLTGECCDYTILENITSMAGVKIRGPPMDITDR